MPWPPPNACRRVALLLFGTALAVHVSLSLLLATAGLDLRASVVISELVALLGLSVWLGRRMGLSPGEALALRPATTAHYAAALAATLPLQVLGSAANRWILELWPEQGAMREILEESMRQLTRVDSLADLLLLLAAGVAAAAVCEEALFRGLMLQLLARHRGWRPAVVWSALLFAAFHLDPIGLLPRFAFGLWLGALVWRSGSLWPAVVAHAGNNGAALFGIPWLTPHIEAHLPLTLLLAAVAAAAVLAWWLHGTTPNPPSVTEPNPPTRSEQDEHASR